MTDRPWRRRFFTWLRKGLAGMPAALRLNEGLGVNAQPLARPRRRWTGQMIEARAALVFACLALSVQAFGLALVSVDVFGDEEARAWVRVQQREVLYWLAPEWACRNWIAPPESQPELCLRPGLPEQ